MYKQDAQTLELITIPVDNYNKASKDIVNLSDRWSFRFIVNWCAKLLLLKFSGPVYLLKNTSPPLFIVPEKVFLKTHSTGSYRVKKYSNNIPRH